MPSTHYIKLSTSRQVNKTVKKESWLFEHLLEQLKQLEKYKKYNTEKIANNNSSMLLLTFCLLEKTPFVAIVLNLYSLVKSTESFIGEEQ